MRTGLVGTREAAEDLTQETFLELYRHAPVLSPGVGLVSWLCRVALNKGYNTLRGQRRAQNRMEQFAELGEQDPYAELLRVEDRERVREVLKRLPERQSKDAALALRGPLARRGRFCSGRSARFGWYFTGTCRALICCRIRVYAPGRARLGGKEEIMDSGCEWSRHFRTYLADPARCPKLTVKI